MRNGKIYEGWKCGPLSWFTMKDNKSKIVDMKKGTCFLNIGLS